jgi:Tol biopolymer transport system component
MSLAAGTRLGPYEIDSLIDSGGMGEVYKGRDTRLGRTVAVKVLPQDIAGDPDRRRRFEQEARAASALNHPHICVVYDVGSAPLPGAPSTRDAASPPPQPGICHFLVMEYLEGQTLAKRLLRGPLPLADALRVGAQLLDALARAHRQGIVHRDLKPANVMLTRDGVKLLDFGLARLTQASDAAGTASTRTQPGTVVGTVPYMAPEQLEGRATDARTDLFAFGAVLYEMVTGRRAFEGTSRVSVITAILERDPPPVTSLQPLAPPLMDRLVATCLAKDPERRWDTAHDVAEQLRGLAETARTETDAGAASGPVSWRWVWTARWWLAAAALVLLLGAPAVWRLLTAESSVGVMVPRQITSSAAWETDPVISPDGTSVAYAAGESGSADIWIVGARGGTPLRLTNDPAWDSSPAWFPDGTEIAFVSDRGGSRSIWKVGRLGGAPTLVVPDAEDPAISPGGDQIAFVRASASGDRRVVVAPLADVAQARVVTGDGDGLWNHRNPAWSPDGQTICYRAQRDLWCIAARGGRARRLTMDGEVDFEPAWSSDGSFVLFSSLREGTQALWRVGQNGGRPVRLTLGTGPERHASVSRDGTRLAYATYLDNFDLVLRDLVSGQTRRYGGVRSDIHPLLSPDGATLYFVSDRQGKYDLWAQALSGIDPSGAPRHLTDYPGSVSLPSCSPDGQWVAFGYVEKNRRAVWMVPTSGGPKVELTDGFSVAGEPAWSPDGSRIAFVSNQSGANRIWVIKVANGRPAGRPMQMNAVPGAQELPTWSPDGTRIAYLSVEGSSKGDVFVVNVGGPASPARVTSGADAVAVRWSPASDRLLVSGLWGGASYRVQAVSPAGGAATAVAEVVGRSQDAAQFDISRDGRLLVLTWEERRGNIWVLEATSRMY